MIPKDIKELWTFQKIREACHNPQLVNVYLSAIISYGVKIGAFVEIGRDVAIGEGTNISSFCFIPEGVMISENCFIGPHVTFLNDKYAPTHGKWRETEKLTVVQEGVSIGGGAVILPGLILGKGCRIGAGAVVTKNVEPGSVVVGNPARKILYTPKKDD